MTFADRMTILPRAYDPSRGAETVAALGIAPGPFADLVAGVAGSSPFLNGVLLKELAWASGLSQATADTAFRALVQDTVKIPNGEVDAGLRQAKRRAALLIAMADLGGLWSLDEVTGALTEFAVTATRRALTAALLPEVRRGKVPGMSETNLATGAGMFVLAMGKMGAGELNYSSDVDLILLFDDQQFAPEDLGAARQAFVRAARRMTKTLAERTGDGYVFRTDLRLRPDASVTPIVVATEVAERYYESLGRTWERAAYIKANPVAGDVAAGHRFLDSLRPFVWRRHLDFAAIQDAHDIRLRIRDTKGLHTAPSHLGHDLKLGAGGIREIEFFTQTRQLIAGGRDAGLRQRGTVGALAALAAAGWVPDEDAVALTEDYAALRAAEHRVQMIADQQTHNLPQTEDEFARLACLAGQDASAYKADLLARFDRVSRLTDAFFAPDETAAKPVEVPTAMQDVVARWPSYPALRSRRAVEIFGRVQPALLTRLEASARPEIALVHIDAFLSGLPAGVQLFSLFEANPQLLDLIVDIAETAPGLARYLSRAPGVFDAVIGGGFFAPWPGVNGLKDALNQVMAEAADYEAALDAARRWQKEWHFRVGVHLLRDLIDADTAAAQYADLAEAVVGAVLPVTVQNFAVRHGAPPGAGAVVLAMGSLGAGRLGPASDLDMIVIYDPADEDASDGPRPLASRPYYARMTQALVTALSAPMAEGRLYEVDMRLRPSGRQGPVATSLVAFETYQANEAWTWEHLALTRARVVAGPTELAERVTAVRAAVLAQSRARDAVISDVAQMRARLAEAKGNEGPYDAKNGPGRLMDIELAASTGALLSGRCTADPGAHMAAAEDALGLDPAALRRASDLYRRVILGQALVRDVGATQFDAGMEQALARFSGVGSAEELAKRLDKTAHKIKSLLDRALATKP